MTTQLRWNMYDGENGDLPTQIFDVIEELATKGSAAERGAIYTRIEVVEFILDLVGYTENEPLHRKRLLEPSFGGGDFLLPAISRLMAAWRREKSKTAVHDLCDAICAVELHYDTYSSTREDVINTLIREGLDNASAIMLADHWLIQGDFLLTPQTGFFDFVVGNPPYVRQELIPAPLLALYRSQYKTMYDRADIYVPFIEKSLSLLNQNAILGFICADRWMKNRYGGPLRKLVAEKYHLKAYIDMVGTAAFHSDVTAYPAITIISREQAGSTRIVHRPDINSKTLSLIANEVRKKVLSQDASELVRELDGVTNGAEPWLLESVDQLALIRRLENEYPKLEEVGCKVGIGVATGADKVFIGQFDSLDVEEARKLPLVTTRDIASGRVEWSGQGIINPFSENGGIVDLNSYPKLQQYFEKRKEVLLKRHCAKKVPANWYRTIDKIHYSLLTRPKLLIPDIKGETHVVFEEGKFYPHHNLYYVVSEQWELRALQAVLLSSISRLFVATYSTQMRGGFLRFQAQYIRRIRIPHWQDVADELRIELREAAERLDLEACNRAVFKLFKLNQAERAALGGNGE